MGHSAATAVFRALINTVTEWADLVEALYQAIHWTARRDGGVRGFMNPFDKSSFVYANLHMVNWRQFMKNLIGNQIEDAFYGKLGQADVFRYQQSGSFAGFTSVDGPSRVFKGAQEQRQNPLLDAIGKSLDDLVGYDEAWLSGRNYGLPPSEKGKPVRGWRKWSKQR